LYEADDYDAESDAAEHAGVVDVQRAGTEPG